MGTFTLPMSLITSVFHGQSSQEVEDNPSRPEFLITEQGVGYRFGGPCS